MKEGAILEGVREVARVHLGHTDPIELDTVLVEALQLDSVRLLTLVVEIENQFRVCLEEGDEAGLETVGDLVSVIGRRLGT